MEPVSAKHCEYLNPQANNLVKRLDALSRS